RPDTDHIWFVTRRLRKNYQRLREPEDLAGGPLRRARPEARRPTAEARDQRGKGKPRQAQGRDLRRARRRSGVDRGLRGGGTRLRELLALPRPHRAPGGGAVGGEALGGEGVYDGVGGRCHSERSEESRPGSALPKRRTAGWRRR